MLRHMTRDGVAISVITYGEVLEGVLGSRERLPAMDTWRGFVAGVDVLEVTVAIAETWAHVRSELRSRGKLIPDNDLIIAATAMRLGMIAVSLNVSDFGRIPGLDLLVPDL